MVVRFYTRYAHNKKLNRIILCFCAVLITSLSIGYSVLQQELMISGDVNYYLKGNYVVDCDGNRLRTTIPDNLTGLARIMAEQAYLDNGRSQYVTNCNGVKFTNIASDTNGRGVYEIASTKNDTYPIYYYRGAVDNNVIFANHCWKAIRTTDTGGVKLIYNGEVDGNQCLSSRGTHVGYGGKTSIHTLTSNYYYGTDFTYENGVFSLAGSIEQKTWNATNAPTLIGKYTCKSTSNTGTCSTLYLIESIYSNTQGYLIPLNGNSNYSRLGTINYNNKKDSFADFGYMYNTRYTFNSQSHYMSTLLGGAPLSINYWYANDITWDSSTNKYVLVNPYKITSISEYPSLVGKYTVFSSENTSSGNASYISYVNGSTSFYVYLTNSGNHTLADFNDTYTYGNTYTDNGNGTYTINNATTIHKSDMGTAYTDIRNQFICINSSNNTCSDLIYSTTSTARNNIYYLKPIDELYKYGNSFSYNSSTDTYTLSNTVDIWNYTDSTNKETISNHHYTCRNSTGTCSTIYYIYHTDTTSLKYVSLTGGRDIETAMDEMMNGNNVNTNNSVIKTGIEAWYKKNLLAYNSFIEDTVFCNERILSTSAFNPNGGSISENVLSSAYNRETSNIPPTLACSKNVDRFSVNNTIGNGKLSYPVGLLTLDESRYAGTYINYTQGSYYLHNNNYFYIITPHGIISDHASMATTGSSESASDVSQSSSLNPVISLSPEVDIAEGGDGTEANPYVVTYPGYNINYTLDGGTASGNPSTYNVLSGTITLNNPTKSNYSFLGWAGSNDVSTGLESYTTSSPLTCDGRDKHVGTSFDVAEGDVFRVFVDAKKTAGYFTFQGGLWYTELTSGNSYEGYSGVFTKIKDLGDGWYRFYKDVTVPAGKTKAQIYIQLNQYSPYTTTWNVANMHIIKVGDAVTIPAGSSGDKNYTAYYKDSIAPVVSTATASSTLDLSSYVDFTASDGETGIAFYNITTSNTAPTTWIPVEEYVQNTTETKYDKSAAWARIFHHNSHYGSVLFSNNTEALSSNTVDKYSELGRLSYYRNYTNNGDKWDFLLEYPDRSTTEYNQWSQTVNPATTTVENGDGSEFVTGYTATHVDWTGNYWGGLALSTSTSTFINGSVGHGNWFYAIAPYTAWQGGFPGPSGSVSNVNLWVKINYVNSDLASITRRIGNIKSNTTYYVWVKDTTGNTASKSVTVSNYDNTVPTVTLTSTNNASTSQTVTVAMGDNKGLDKYYFGTSNPASTNVTYTSISGSPTSKSVTSTISANGTYYVSVIDKAGNRTTSSIVFYGVTAASNNTSYGTVSPASQNIKSGNNATITLSPATGYKYSSNNCGGTVSGNTMTVSNVTAAKSCTVTFAKQTFTVTATSNNTSYGTVSPASQTVNYGANATITLSPASGYQYSSNNCGGTVSGSTMTVSNITAAKSCTVTFVGKTWRYDYTGSYKKFTAPTAGTYKIELWGAGSTYSSSVKTYGAYVTGNVTLSNGQVLYVYVGQEGKRTAWGEANEGGWNGGGTKNGDTCTGGGATDVRLATGNLNSRIMVAGGGGGTMSEATAGNGGLTSGVAGAAGSITQGKGGTQTTGGAGCKFSDLTGNSGSFGKGGNANADCGGGGGGGWYGGGSGIHQHPGGTLRGCGASGGSSFVHCASGYTHNSNATYTSSQYCFSSYSGKTGTSAYNYQVTRGRSSSTNDGYAIITLVS